MRSRLFLLSLFLMSMYLLDAFAYEKQVHERVTRNAFIRTGTTIDYARRLGVDVTRQVAGEFPRRWCEIGSKDEDDIFESIPPFRSLHHFYDPVHGASLTVGTPPLCFAFIPTTSIPIPTIRADSWAVDSHALNDWNLSRARSYQRQAILGPNPGTREDRERRVAGDKPIVWVSNGSFDEDDIFESTPPFRSLHHFYDPVHGASLTVGIPPLCFALAHYLLTRVENGQLHGYHVYFARDSNGVWRVLQF